MDSILQNTYHNIEVICINDGSTDHSLGILQKYEKRDQRITIINQSCQGASHARNNGLSQANGEFIAFIDSDDWISENYFEFLHRAICENESDIAFCDYCLTAGEYHFDEKPLYQAVNLKIDDIYPTRKSAYVWRRLYRKSVLQDVWFDESSAVFEDCIFNLDVITHRRKIRFSYVNLVLYAYFQRQDSLVSLIDFKAKLKNANRYITDYCSKEISPLEKSLFSEDAVKRALSVRFYCKINGELDNVQFANRIIHSGIPYLKKKRLLYYILYKIPYIYRTMMVSKDKSLLDWEKRMKSDKRQII